MDRIQESIEFIRQALENNPNHAYLTHDRNHLCVLVAEGQKIIVIPGDYSEATDEEINQMIQTFIQDL